MGRNLTYWQFFSDKQPQPSLNPICDQQKIMSLELSKTGIFFWFFFDNKNCLLKIAVKLMVYKIVIYIILLCVCVNFVYNVKKFLFSNLMSTSHLIIFFNCFDLLNVTIINAVTYRQNNLFTAKLHLRQKLNQGRIQKVNFLFMIKWN